MSALGLTLVLLADVASQVPTDPVVLWQRLEDKLASRFLRDAAWHTDLEQARRAAASEGKLILVHCTRSFIPCGTSIRCEREVLGKPEFASLATRVVLYCHVTAHVDPAQDRFLFEMRGSGWPHHAVIDATGRVLGAHESWRDKSVAVLASLVDQAQAYLRVETETRAEVARANHRRLTAGLAAGALDLREARRLLAGCGELPREAADRLAAQVTDLEVMDVLARYDRFDNTVQAAAGAELFALWRQGKRPQARNAMRDFWGGIMLHVEKQEKPDLDLYRDALRTLDELLGKSPGYRGFLDERRKTLETLTRKARMA